MSGAWHRLSEGGAAHRVLAVDFDATGRHEATFRDLVRALPGPLTVWHATPPPAGQPFLDWWAGQVPDEVTAVLGYCAGGVFACALADDLERRTGRRPTVVLFNPGPPTVATVHRDFGAVFDAMAALDESEGGALRARLAAATVDTDDLGLVGSRLLEIHQDACRRIFPRMDIDPDVGEQLSGLLRSYVSYLTAARRLPPRPAWAAATSLFSREYDGVAGFGTPVLFDVARARLLADPEVAATAYGLVTGSPPSGRTHR
jgi:hypothetical protein